MTRRHFLTTAALASAASEAHSLERRVFDLTNEMRRGLRPLERSAGLTEAARRHSGDMNRRQYFDHANPEGMMALDRVNLVDRRLVGGVGENIWMWMNARPPGTDTLARRIVDSWMNSDGHRRNILHPDYTHLGVGVSRSGGFIHATQNFARVDGMLRDPLPTRPDAGGVLRITVDSERPAVKAEARNTSTGESVTGVADIAGGLVLPTTAGACRLIVWFDEGDQLAGGFGPVFFIGDFSQGRKAGSLAS